MDSQMLASDGVAMGDRNSELSCHAPARSRKATSAGRRALSQPPSDRPAGRRARVGSGAGGASVVVMRMSSRVSSRR
jgi:hypothetical protein